MAYAASRCFWLLECLAACGQNQRMSRRRPYTMNPGRESDLAPRLGSVEFGMSAGRHALLSHVWESLSNIIQQPIRPVRGSGHQTCSCSGKSRPRCKVPPSTDLIHASRLLTSDPITGVMMISATTGTQTWRLMDGGIQQSAAN